MSLEVRNISKYSTVILAITILALSSIFGGIVLLGVFFPSLTETAINLNFSIPYWSFIITLFIAYIVSALSEITNRVADSNAEILNKTMPHLEIFQDTTSFHDRMASLNAVATSIYATNFSYAPSQKTTGPRQKYHRALDILLADKKSDLKSFRVIANADDFEKAKWVVQRAQKYEHNNRFSMIVIDGTYTYPLQTLHIVVTSDSKYCFFFPAVQKHESLTAFLITDMKLADMLIAQFNEAWLRGFALIEGGVLNHAAITKLQSKFPSQIW